MKPYLHHPPPSLSLISHLSAQETEKTPKTPQRTMRIRHSFSMKIHPSPSSPSSSAAPPFSAVMNLLPPEIYSEISGLPLEDLEVLAYLMNRSSPEKPPSKPKKKSPSYEFELYGSFWNRWNSSANRNLISKAIDAYEESLDFSGAGESRRSGGKKKKDRKGKRGSAKRLDFDAPIAGAGVLPELQVAGGSPGVEETGNEVAVLIQSLESVEEVQDSGGTSPEQVWSPEMSPAADMNRGLARKVLPDVVGFFNSRLWNLWRPKV